MAALIIRLPAHKRERLRRIAKTRGVTVEKLIDDLASALIAENPMPRRTAARPPGPTLAARFPAPPRAAIDEAYRRPEQECLPPLIAAARLPDELALQVHALAGRLVTELRATRARSSGVDALMQEFSLSSEEGVALMCLAEALLRVPDTDNADRLIREKIKRGDWHAHLGNSPSLFVNAVTWGLLVTGKLVGTSSERGLAMALNRLVAKGGEPLIRKGVDLAMRMLGEQFVTGRTIEEALTRAQANERRGYCYSFDMLGEAALTAADAQRHRAGYEHAIHAIGKAAGGRGVHAGPGISVKLSALHPRYSFLQHDRVMSELLPRLKMLALLARQYDIGFNIDAEEADRLDLSLDLLEALAGDAALDGWNGLGFVVQAYQKRAPQVVEYLVDLARRGGHRIMVRLVKGAYWDAEIKRAQVDGLEGYPVFTRKVYTDVCYLACAKKLLANRETVFPQFATHNAQTLAAVYHLAGTVFTLGDYEFQGLHGMGESLYDQVVGADKLQRPCRIYAPVGGHQTLLAYLVRRLLENGANTSFVNRTVDERVAIDELIADPVAEAAAHDGEPHPRIALPRALFGAERVNSRGIDLSSRSTRRALEAALRERRDRHYAAHPMVAGLDDVDGEMHLIVNPADHRDHVGRVVEATPEVIDEALRRAAQAAASWAQTPVEWRAGTLDRTADALEAHIHELIALCVREAGKTLANGIAEVREAVDFCRYHAQQIRTGFDNATHLALGPVVCISPWNFPLAIFMGQVSAALAAGNPVLAKPAEQTPLVAAYAVRLLREAGVPRDVVQLLPGRGETGARLVQDTRIKGVIFTGSTEVAHGINRVLAARTEEVVLIAETGGQNAMIVDSTALPEQVVADVIASAFDSAGQRCSCLRVLCLQQEIADKLILMLIGAMRELRLGDPRDLATDVGPVIDADAKSTLEGYIERVRRHSKLLNEAQPGQESGRGTFVAPTLVEIRSLGELQGEVFGPVLHVLRFERERLDELIEDINATGYGLTLGIHTRIDETIEFVTRRARVGNIYVNRGMTGAVVGVQPFGGEGLSGTGPKAGGPLYLHRLLRAAPGPALDGAARDDDPAAAVALAEWLEYAGESIVSTPDLSTVHDFIEGYLARTLLPLRLTLPGPVGEENTLSFAPRGTALCIGESTPATVRQIGAALATGNRALLEDCDMTRALLAHLPEPVRAWIDVVADWRHARFDAVLFSGADAEASRLRAELARRPGAIVALLVARPDYDMHRLLVEQSLSINTTAAGGNAHLMTLGT